MSKLFKGLKKGLEEALAYSKREITLKSEIIEIPAPSVEYDSSDFSVSKTNSCDEIIADR